MGFGRKRPPAPPNIGPPPTPKEMEDVIDEISRVQTIMATGPDGRKRRVFQRINMTQAEEVFLKTSEELLAQSISNIQQLYKYDPSSIVKYQPFIKTFAEINQERMDDLAQIGGFEDIEAKVNDFKQLNRQLVNREFDTQSRAQEELLAKRGWSSSTLAAEQKAAMAGERAIAEQQAAINAELYGDDLMRKRLARQSDLYAIREQGRGGRLDQAQTEYELQRQAQADAEALRQGAVIENQNNILTGRQAKSDDLAKSQLALSQLSTGANITHNQNMEALNTYNADVNRQQQNYRMHLDKFKNTPASFTRQLLGTVGNAAARGVGTSMGGGITSFVSNLF